jgi:hypothetical protein
MTKKHVQFSLKSSGGKLVTCDVDGSQKELIMMFATALYGHPELIPLLELVMKVQKSMDDYRGEGPIIPMGTN